MKILTVALCALLVLIPLHAKADWTYYVATLDCNQDTHAALVRFGVDSSHKQITFSSDTDLAILSLAPNQSCELKGVGKIALNVTQGMMHSGSSSDPTGIFDLYINEKPVYYSQYFHRSFMDSDQSKNISELRISNNQLFECREGYYKFIDGEFINPCIDVSQRLKVLPDDEAKRFKAELQQAAIKMINKDERLCSYFSPSNKKSREKDHAMKWLFDTGYKQTSSVADVDINNDGKRIAHSTSVILITTI